MLNDDPPYVFAVVEVMGTEMIDSGRTLAVRLRKATGDEAVVLLSLALAEDLNRQIELTLNRDPRAV